MLERFRYPLATCFYASTWLLLLVTPLGVAPGLRNTLLLIVAGFGFYGFLRTPAKARLSWLPLAAWCAFILASAGWSWNPYGTIKSAVMDVLLPVGAMIGALTLTRKEGAQGFGFCIALAQLIIGMTALGLVLASGSEAVFNSELHIGWLSAYPGVGVATTVAVLSMPFSVAGVLQPEARLRIISIASMAAILIIALLSKNRAFWLAAPVVLAVQLLITLVRSNRGRFLGAKWLAMICGVAALVVAGWLHTTESRMPQNAGIQRGVFSVFSDDVRWSAWRIWIEKGLESPVLGFGYGKRNIPSELEPEYRGSLQEIGFGVAGHGHNLMLNLWLQTGWVGIGLFLLMAGAIVRYLLTGRTANGAVSTGATIGVCLLVALVLKNMTDDFYGQAVAVYFWLLMGIALGMHQSEIERAEGA